LNPTEVGQHPVDYKEVEGFCQGARERRLAVPNRFGGVALLAKYARDQPSQTRLVFYNQYPHRRFPDPSPSFYMRC
jgi:hypothetical protein